MVGKSIKITFLLILVFLSCTSNDKNFNKIGNDIIHSNINILLDSLSIFDISEIPMPSKYKDTKFKKNTVGVLDSVVNEDIIIEDCKTITCKEFKKRNCEFERLNFNLSKNVLEKFNSKYTATLIINEKNELDVINVKFSNFLINKSCDKASIVVTKKRVIGMIKCIYIFEKTGKNWKVKNKHLISIG